MDAEDKNGALVKVGKYEIKVPLCEKSTEGNIYIAAYQNEIVVVKVFFSEKAFLKEKRAYQMLSTSANFPRVMPIEGVHTTEKIKHKQEPLEIKKTENVLIMEYYEKSMLFYYIWWINQHKTKFSRLSPPTCRAFARKLINGIRELDRQGLGHRDLKLQNILVDNSYQLKIFDFGHSEPSKDENGEHIKFRVNPLKEPFGTQYYWTPESKEDKQYTLIQYDLYSLGIILFFLYTRVPPFNMKKSALNKDYQLFVKNNKKFWKNKSTQAGFQFQPEFINLMNCFLSANQAQRPTLDDLMPNEQKFEWFHGEESTEKEVQKEMNTIYRHLKLIPKFRERQKIIQEHLQSFQFREIGQSKKSRGGSGDMLEILEHLDINTNNLQVNNKNDRYEFSQEFAKLALICFKDYLDHMDEEQNSDEQKWSLQTNQMGTGFILRKQEKEIRGIFEKTLEDKIFMELIETNLQFLEEQMVKYEFKAILWNCFTMFP